MDLTPQRAKALSEWRAAEAKNKSKCYANAKDNERVQDAVLDCKLGRGRDGRTRSFCQDEPNHDFCGSFEFFGGKKLITRVRRMQKRDENLNRHGEQGAL